MKEKSKKKNNKKTAKEDRGAIENALEAGIGVATEAVDGFLGDAKGIVNGEDKE